MSFPLLRPNAYSSLQGGRSERGPRVGIPVELFHSPTSVCLPSHLEGPAKSVALGPSYDAVRLHTPICSNLLCEQLRQGFCPVTGSLLSSAQRDNRGSPFFRPKPWLSSPEEGWDLHPLLDLRRLNYSLYREKFRMLTLKIILSQVQEGEWFITVDLKDAYFLI